MDEVLKNAILNGLYSQNYLGHEALNPQILLNNDVNNIWFTLRRELLTCKSFDWTVAFITQDMLVPLKAVLEDLAVKGIKGTLITGTYQGFNDPKAFAELQKIPNLTVRIAEMPGFHAKGYLFNHGNYQTAIIGSANFTRAALLSNYEWSLKISSRENSALLEQINQEFAFLRKNSFKLSNEWLETYKRNWQPIKRSEKLNISQEIKPNRMQKAALEEIKAMIKGNKKRALVVSATGTGKTYLGAFSVKDYKPKRFLYVVHREQIAQKALSSFKKVIGGDNADYGLLVGGHTDINAKYLFATVQTLSQPRIMEHFKTATFDYILIDEAHRSAAPSYQRILNYFKPKFCLGMTATPERTDEEDVFSIFDYNLACEIRLNDALKENMLAPFHYVGIQDYELDGQTSDDFSKLRFLTTDARVDYILKELDYYGYCGDMPRGLVFCSRQEEAQALAEAFSKKGHKAVALTNRDSRTKRHKVVNDLEIGKIEYIITVDLFNEGIDIPSLNQIVMLRNTQSSIVFIQQLGRGLRKYPGKDFVTIIDFIGNYKNNYLIPIALNDDISRDKDQVRRETQLPQLIGVSTINFRQVAAEKILNSLNAIKLDGLTELRKAYIDLKHKLGRSPLLMDFEKFGSVSPIVFAKNHNLANYAVFLKKMGEKLVLSEYQGQILTFITKELLNGKRKHELLLLKLLLEKKQCTFDEFEQELKKTNSYIDQAVLDSVMAILSLSFFDVKAGKSTKKEQYGNTPLVEKCNLLDYKLNEQLQESLQTNSDFKRLFVDVITTGLRLSEAYKGQYQFTLYKQYNRKDVCRLLNWPLDVSAPMYGYRVTDNECPIFITYQKDDSKKRNSIYQNTLENGQILRWYTRTPRHLESAEVQKLLAGVDSGKPKVKIHLFVKQSDAVGKEFFYLGTAKIQKDSVKEEKLGLKKNKVAVGMNLELTHSLSPNMYEMLFDDLLL